MSTHSNLNPKISVLYVDDEEGLLALGKIYLERIGLFEIDPILSAPEALDKLSLKEYDAIISDYQMPGMNGLEFLQQVRKRFGSVPFILFTGRGREEIIIKAIENGVDFYIQKGGDPRSQFAELSHKLKIAVERRRAVVDIQENRDYLNQIFSSVKEGIIIVDAQTHTIIDLNPAAAALFKAEKEEIIGKICHKFICPTDYGSCPITDLHQQVDNSERVLVTAEGKHLPIIKNVALSILKGGNASLKHFLTTRNESGFRKICLPPTNRLPVQKRNSGHR